MKKTSILVLAILLLTACTKDSSQDSLSVENAEAKQNNGKRVTRPISNSLQSDPDFSLPPLSCSNGPGIGGGALIYGNMAHMGKVTGQAVNQACEYMADGRLRLTSKDVTIAANGDKIYTEGEIFITIVSATMATITGGSKITGGTGRFAGATGYFIYENMVLDLLTGHESHTAYGEITY
jgi:hypothetical protein